MLTRNAGSGFEKSCGMIYEKYYPIPKYEREGRMVRKDHDKIDGELKVMGFFSAVWEVAVTRPDGNGSYSGY